jgi:hypothetical protein
MGWTDDKFSAPVTLRGEDPGVTDSVLYFRKLDPEIATEFGDLMLTSSIYEWESSLGDALITSSYNLGSDGYSIRFQPSLPVEFSSVDNLNLTIGSNSGPIPTLLNAAIWNYQTGAWQPLALDTYGNVEVPEPEQCVGMDGEIFMNIQGDPNAYFDITSIDFTLRVQPRARSSNSKT